MKRLILIFLTLGVAALAKDAPAALLLPEHPTSRELAVSANRYIALGEERAVLELKEACEKGRKPYQPHHVDFNLSEQIGWLCRLLYTPKPGQTLRAPGFGALMLPFNTMPPADWPLMPLAESKGVFFILAQSYTIAGVPEDPVHYLEYCAQSGSFRREALRVPTPNEAERALSALLASPAWKQIKWQDGGHWFSYTLHESDSVAYLQKQTLETSPQPKAEPPSFTDSASQILGQQQKPVIQEFR
jgi:hypothetical protein